MTTDLQDLLIILGLGLLHFRSSREIILEVSAHMLPGSETLEQETGSLETSTP
jgi:hypothetical protein